MKVFNVAKLAYTWPVIFISVASASEIECSIPDGVLHDACVTHLSVTIRSSHCSITFVPTCYNSQGVGHVASKPIQSRVRPDLSAPSSACFVFNGERYCE